jgi:hypothetical protein
MAIRYSISISETLAKQIDTYVQKHKKEYDSSSSFFQKRADEYLNPGTKNYIPLMMLYLGYPIIILTILLKASIDTGNVIYNYISALISGFLLVGLYLFIDKQRGKKKK